MGICHGVANMQNIIWFYILNFCNNMHKIRENTVKIIAQLKIQIMVYIHIILSAITFPFAKNGFQI